MVDEYDTPILKLLGRDPAEVEPFFELFRDFHHLFKQCESDLHNAQGPDCRNHAPGVR